MAREKERLKTLFAVSSLEQHADQPGHQLLVVNDRVLILEEKLA
jgi:hypothetical protein